MTSLPEVLASLYLLLPVDPGPELNGRSSTNRAWTPPELCQINANGDVTAVGVWVAEFAHSPHTFRSYRTEALRLLRWAIKSLPAIALSIVCRPPQPFSRLHRSFSRSPAMSSIVLLRSRLISSRKTCLP